MSFIFFILFYRAAISVSFVLIVKTFNLLYDDYDIFMHSKCFVLLAGINKTETMGEPLQQLGVKGVLCLLLYWYYMYYHFFK